MSENPSDYKIKWYESNLQTTRDLGFYAIKTLVTLNSGAFVVMLTFLGNAAAQTKFSLELYAIKQAMFCFLLGISSTAFVVGAAYINSMRMSPFDESKGIGDSLAIVIYVGLCFVAFAAFLSGVLITICGVVEL